MGQCCHYIMIPLNEFFVDGWKSSPEHILPIMAHFFFFFSLKIIFFSPLSLQRGKIIFRSCRLFCQRASFHKTNYLFIPYNLTNVEKLQQTVFDSLSVRFIRLHKAQNSLTISRWVVQLTLSGHALTPELALTMRSSTRSTDFSNINKTHSEPSNVKKNDVWNL